MNKYQQAFDYIVIATNCGDGITLQLLHLKELVDKEIPMAPDKDETGTYVCGRCKEYSVTSEGNYSREYERCTMANCGQVVDWSEIHDENKI